MNKISLKTPIDYMVLDKPNRAQTFGEVFEQTREAYYSQVNKPIRQVLTEAYTGTGDPIHIAMLGFFDYTSLSIRP